MLADDQTLVLFGTVARPEPHRLGKFLLFRSRERGNCPRILQQEKG
jgi:hypothetical protein